MNVKIVVWYYCMYVHACIMLMLLLKYVHCIGTDSCLRTCLEYVQGYILCVYICVCVRPFLLLLLFMMDGCINGLVCCDEMHCHLNCCAVVTDSANNGV